MGGGQLWELARLVDSHAARTRTHEESRAWSCNAGRKERLVPMRVLKRKRAEGRAGAGRWWHGADGLLEGERAGVVEVRSRADTLGLGQAQLLLGGLSVCAVRIRVRPLLAGRIISSAAGAMADARREQPENRRE